MAKVALFLIDGFEETEALATVDILRRGEVDVTTVSLTGKERVMGKHSVPVVADALFEDAKDGPFDMLVVPGGTIAYTEHEGLLELVRRYDAGHKFLAAICAAPAVFGKDQSKDRYYRIYYIRKHMLKQYPEVRSADSYLSILIFEYKWA